MFVGTVYTEKRFPGLGITPPLPARMRVMGGIEIEESR